MNNIILLVILVSSGLLGGWLAGRHAVHLQRYAENRIVAGFMTIVAAIVGGAIGVVLAFMVGFVVGFVLLFLFD